jgi:hypothetical protein
MTSSTNTGASPRFGGWRHRTSKQERRRTELYCTAYEGFVDTFGIDESVINSNQSIEFVKSVYKRVRGPHAGFIGISAAGGLCSRDVMRSTADFFLLLGEL